LKCAKRIITLNPIVMMMMMMMMMLINVCVDSGNTPETRGSAFVIYEDIFDAKNACDHLSGFNVCNRYLVVLYYQPNKVSVCRCC